jgi:hypothetical protein
MKTRERMASPTRVNGMPTKMARCTAMITKKRIHMGTDIHMITITITPMDTTTDTVIHTTHHTR